MWALSSFLPCHMLNYFRLVGTNTLSFQQYPAPLGQAHYTPILPHNANHNNHNLNVHASYYFLVALGHMLVLLFCSWVKIHFPIHTVPLFFIFFILPFYNLSAPHNYKLYLNYTCLHPWYFVLWVNSQRPAITVTPASRYIVHIFLSFIILTILSFVNMIGSHFAPPTLLTIASLKSTYLSYTKE